MKSKIYSSRFLAIILTIALLVTSMPLSIFAVESTSLEDSTDNVSSSEAEFEITPKEDLEETTVLSEVVSRREENVKHFDIGNGMYQAVTYGTAVHRKDADGTWQDIDNRLLLDYENNIYSTPDGRTQAALSINANTPLISLNENGYTISMTPMTKTLSISSSAEIVNHQIKNFDNVSGTTIKDVAEISNSSSIKYTNVFTATDIEYVLESNDIKENIIVKSPQNSYEYSFSLTVDKLMPVLKQTGDIVFLDDETSEEKYHIPAPFMYDSSGELSYDVYYELSGAKGSYIVTVIADPEWVNTDNRSFPVTIDPTIQKSIVYDTYINSSSPKTNYGSSSELWVSSGRISFLKCTMPAIPTGCSFYAANLYVYYYYHSNVTDGGLTAGAYQVMKSWSETGTNGLTWNIAQPSTTTYISSTRLSTGYMSGSRGAYSSSPKTTSFDVTAAATSWYADSSTNHGIALKYESGTNGSVILKSYEAGSAYRAYFVITYTEPQIVSGVYRIKNAQNGLYLDTTGGGYSAGTEIQQWSQATSDTNRNQLFKITFVRTFGSTDQLNYYTIRPMTNSAMGLESSLSGTSRDVTIETMSTSDDWANLLYNHLWVISKSGSYYTIKNGRISDTSYLTAPSNTTNGETIFTADSISDYSKWTLEPYSGDSIHGILWNDFPSRMIAGQTYWCDADMYSSSVGSNGPVTYRVGNTDYSATDKATIDTHSGKLQVNIPGTIKVGVTYSGAPWVWWKTITIEPSLEGTYHFKNKETSKLMQPDNQDKHFMEQHDDDGTGKQSWIVEHYGEGYYTIRNIDSRLYLTAPDNSDSGDNIVEQALSTGIIDRQIWRLTKLSSGSYKVQAKAREGTSMCLVLGAGIGNGVNIRQKEFSSDTNYRDEWELISANDKAIVIIPGIVCSHLQLYDGSHIWFNDTRLTPSGLDEIECDENGDSIRNDVLPYNPDNYGILNIYSSLYNKLKDEYKEEYDIIFFAYDWRLSCADAAEQLEAVLTNYTDCILIAHSMGGIVASSYLDRSNTNRNKVDKFISLGTPYLGAPKALYTIETGELMGFITQALYNLEKYAKNMPAVYELLPTEEYFARYASYITYNGTTISGFDNSWNLMKSLDWAKKEDTSIKPMFDNAKSFHDSLINGSTHITDHTNVDTYMIVGTGENTIGTVVYNSDGTVDSLKLLDGDGTVPTYSATNNKELTSDNVYTVSASHALMVLDSDCIEMVFSIISGETIESLSTSTAQLASKNDDTAITIVTKNISQITIMTNDGYELFNDGKKVYYIDNDGTQHIVGDYWYLNDGSAQYLLNNNNYVITDIEGLDDSSTIRIDYCASGLSDAHLTVNQLNTCESITIPEQDLLPSISNILIIQEDAVLE